LVIAMTNFSEPQTPPPNPARDPTAPHVLRHDIETRSRVDLKVVGAAKYAADPSTEILCLAFAVDDEPVQMWLPGDPVPGEFIEAAKNPAWTAEAHNSPFETAHAKSILEPRHKFPAIPIERRRCSMAMAYAAALPGKLEKAVEALGLPRQKDKAGQALMKRMSKPRPDGSWIEDAESLTRLCEYCRRDVEAERALSKALLPLVDDEQKLWVIDQTINARGFGVDGELLEAAHRIVTETEAKLQAEFRELTGLGSTNQTVKFIAWLGAQGCAVDDVQKGTLRHALRRKGLTPDARRAIELRLQLARVSAAKVEALLAWRGADNRVRGSLVFHGASTGRWVGRGPQPQNFKRDSEGTDTKIAAVMAGGAGLESPVEVVGDIARAMIVAAPGRRLMIGDFSGIESRVLAWISGQQSKLDQWSKFDRTGAQADDPYYIMGRACGLAEDIARAKGKICDLAFGYMGSLRAWKNQAPDGDVSTDEDIERYKKSWRARHP
jgi:DNA polymerase bacteriophage-type